MARALRTVWGLLLAGSLAGALLLGFAAARGVVDPGLHGMASVVAAGLAVASHVRRGGGADFLAVVLLLATVGLGTVAQGGGGSATLHLTLALVATGLSAGLHLLGGVGARLPMTRETRG